MNVFARPSPIFPLTHRPQAEAESSLGKEITTTTLCGCFGVAGEQRSVSGALAEVRACCGLISGLLGSH